MIYQHYSNEDTFNAKLHIWKHNVLCLTPHSFKMFVFKPRVNMIRVNYTWICQMRIFIAWELIKAGRESAVLQHLMPPLAHLHTKKLSAGLNVYKYRRG